MSGSATVSAGADVIDVFGVGVTGGLSANANASATANAYAYIRCTYDGGTVSVTDLDLGADFTLSWHFSVNANAGVYVELKMPDIPVISSLSHEVSSWPVIGWFVPDLTKLKWRKDFTKSWPLITENGQRTWTKNWDVLADGSSPNAKHSLTLDGDQPYDFQSAIDQLVEGAKPNEDIPDKHEGPDAELKDGAKASAVAHTRQAAKAQVKSARDNIKRERTWNSRELAQVKKRIKKAAATAPKGPQLAAASPPPLVIGGGGGGTPDEQYKAELEEREDKLENADVGAQNVDKKIDEVKSAAEDRIEGPARNEAREGFEKLGENADNLGQAVGGYGAKASEFERPVDPAAPATAQSADADKARLEARQVLDEVDEKVDEEMIRSDREWHDAIQVQGLAGYAKHLDSYRADIRITCETPLAKLNTEYLDVPRLYSNLDEQAQVYRTIIIADARDIERKFTTLLTHLPAQPWDTRYAVLEDGKLRLIPSYRTKKKVRDEFYPSGDYRKGTRDWRDQTLAKLGLATMDGKQYWRYTGDRHGQTNQHGDDWWLRDDINEKPTIDHKHESVARHWNRAGHLEDQTSRADYYNGYGAYDAHLEVLPYSVNSAKGNLEDRIPYEFTVGVGFRGPKGR
jgi:hypothetical protein